MALLPKIAVCPDVRKLAIAGSGLLLSSLSSNQKLWRTIGFAQAMRRLADPKRQSKGRTRSMGKKNSIRGQENIGFRLLWFLEEVARKCSLDLLTAYK